MTASAMFRQAALAGLVMLFAGGAAAAVTVTYAYPENYRDIPDLPTDRDELLKWVSDHFALLARDLPAGQDLRVDVLDFDLAGQGGRTARRLGDMDMPRMRADWPRMVLRYRLESNGQVIASGEDVLRDMNYMDHINRYDRGDRLRYEKRMIDEWFKERFPAPKPDLAAPPKPAAGDQRG